MTMAEAQREALALARQAKDWSLLGTSYFDLLAANTAVDPCVFNRLRQRLTPEEYAAFDRAYCDYMRPQDRELNDWLRKKGDEERWKERRKALLLKKGKLLRESLRR